MLSCRLLMWLRPNPNALCAATHKIAFFFCDRPSSPCNSKPQIFPKGMSRLNTGWLGWIFRNLSQKVVQIALDLWGSGALRPHKRYHKFIRRIQRAQSLIIKTGILCSPTSTCVIGMGRDSLYLSATLWTARSGFLRSQRPSAAMLEELASGTSSNTACALLIATEHGTLGSKKKALKFR